jgi:hypothetical protein
MVRNASNDLKAEISKAADADPSLKDAKESVQEIKDSIDDTVGRLK